MSCFKLQSVILKAIVIEWTKQLYKILKEKSSLLKKINAKLNIYSTCNQSNTNTTLLWLHHQRFDCTKNRNLSNLRTEKTYKMVKNGKQRTMLNLQRPMKLQHQTGAIRIQDAACFSWPRWTAPPNCLGFEPLYLQKNYVK